MRPAPRLFSLTAMLAIVLTGCDMPEKGWQEVKSKLAVIKERDQRYRSKMDSVARIEGWRSKKVSDLYEEQRVLDSVNLVEVDLIISTVGYPSRASVGELSEVPFEVIRHSNDSIMNAYLPLIIGAGKNGDIHMDQVATFEDRALASQQQPQEYGTQIWIDFKENSKTGERYDSVYLWPVRDPSRVESKRAAVGLDSLGKQLRRYGIDPAQGYLLRKSGTTR